MGSRSHYDTAWTKKQRFFVSAIAPSDREAITLSSSA